MSGASLTHEMPVPGWQMLACQSLRHSEVGWTFDVACANNFLIIRLKPTVNLHSHVVFASISQSGSCRPSFRSNSQTWGLQAFTCHCFRVRLCTYRCRCRCRSRHIVILPWTVGFDQPSWYGWPGKDSTHLGYLSDISQMVDHVSLWFDSRATEPPW